MGSLICGGDVNIQGRPEPARTLQGLAEVLASADRRFVNLEGPFCGSRGAGIDIPHKPNWTHSEPAMIEGLTAVGVDVVACANNVTFPAAAALDSLEVLDRAGIAHCGAGVDQQSAHAPALVDVAGIQVAILGYTSICWPFAHAATAASGGVAALRAHTTYRPDYRVLEVPGRAPTVVTAPWPEDLARLASDIDAARSAADAVVVSAHWGVAGDRLADYQTTYAHAAVDAGAALVLGHGPHTIQAVETYRDVPILYSLGNLAFDWEPMRGRHLEGLLARATFSRTSHGARVQHLELLPTARNDDNNVAPLAGQPARELLEHVAALASTRATTLTVSEAVAHLEVRPSTPAPDH